MHDPFVISVSSASSCQWAAVTGYRSERMVIYRSVKDIQALSAKVIYETALKLYDLDQKIPGKYQPVLSRFFADYFAK